MECDEDGERERGAEWIAGWVGGWWCTEMVQVMCLVSGLSSLVSRPSSGWLGWWLRRLPGML